MTILNTMITGQLPSNNGTPTPTPTQAPPQNYHVYDGSLSLHWYDQSWTATINYAATDPEGGSNRVISYQATSGWAALQLRTDSELDLTP
jgi:hypothetical protein